MWIADMEFAVAPEIRQAIKDRVDKKILGYTGVYDSDYYDAFHNGVSIITIGSFLKKS